MNRRLIACDLDGTLLDSRGHASTRTRAVTALLRTADWPLVLATARPVTAVRPVVEELGYRGLVVCSNGCLSYHFGTREIVGYRPVEEAAVRRAVSVLRQADPRVRLGAERGLEVLLEGEFSFDKVGAEAAIRVSRLEAALDGRGIGKLLVQLPGNALEYRAPVSRWLPAGFEVTASAADFCEVTVVGVTKASALRDFTTSLGFRSADVVAFGDMPNDVPVIAWAGTGVAVANAHAEVLAVADAVTLTNDEDGVATYLETLLAHPVRSPGNRNAQLLRGRVRREHVGVPGMPD